MSGSRCLWEWVDADDGFFVHVERRIHGLDDAQRKLERRYLRDARHVRDDDGARMDSLARSIGPKSFQLFVTIVRSSWG